MNRDINNAEDVIDSRDVIARIEELEGEREALADEVTEAREYYDNMDNDASDDAIAMSVGAIEAAETDLRDWDGDNGEELIALRALADEGENSAEDWRHGATLVRDSYFSTYAEELIQDIGGLPRNIPSYLVIDWEATAANIQQDYSSVEFDGVTYWVR